MSEKEKYLDIREKLKSLPRVEASDDFVNQLQAKINIIEAEKQSNSIHKENIEKLEGGFFAKLFGQSTNPWLVPAFGVTAVIALVFVWVFVISNNNTSEDMTSSGEKTGEQITGNSKGDRKDNIVSKEEKTETGGEEEIPGENIANDLDIGRNESGLSSRLSTSDSRTERDDEFTGDIELAPVRKVTEEETGVMDQKVVSPGVDMERKEGVVSKKSGKSPNPKEIDGTVKESRETISATMPKDKKESDKSSKKEEGMEKNKQNNVEIQTLTDEVKQESESEKTSINNVIDSTSLESLRERVIEK